MTGTPVLECETRMGETSASHRRRVVLGIAALLTLILGALEIGQIRKYYALEKEDWRGVAAYLEARLVDGDVILCDGVLASGGGDAPRAQRALRYYLRSKFPEVRIVRESELPGKLGELGNDGREVWAVVFRGWRKLKPGGAPGVAVTDFEDVSVVRAENPCGDLRENALFMLEALVRLMPEEEATVALYAARDRVKGQSARSHLTEGNSLLEQGDVDLAISEFELALQMDPSLAGAHVRLADVWLEQGHTEDAIDGYRRAFELKPEWAEQAWLHMRLANAYRDAGQTEEATREYRQVLDLEPGHSAAAKNLENLPGSVRSD